jgi:hypothetical protein
VLSTTVAVVVKSWVGPSLAPAAGREVVSLATAGAVEWCTEAGQEEEERRRGVRSETSKMAQALPLFGAGDYSTLYGILRRVQ